MRAAPLCATLLWWKRRSNADFRYFLLQYPQDLVISAQDVKNDAWAETSSRGYHVPLGRIYRVADFP